MPLHVALFCVVTCTYRPPDRTYSLFFLTIKHNIWIKHTALGRKGGGQPVAEKKTRWHMKISHPATPLGLSMHQHCLLGVIWQVVVVAVAVLMAISNTQTSSPFRTFRLI